MQKKLKYSTAVRGRYEVFDICRELSKLQLLHQLISTYPLFEIKKYNIDLTKVKKILRIEIMSRINDKLWDRNFYFSKIDYIITDYFDKLTSNALDKNIDIFIGHGGMCLKTFNSLKKNTLKVFHSASMHIKTKKYLMQKIDYDINKIIDKDLENKILNEIETADYIVCTSNHTYNSYIINNVDEKKLILNPSGINTNKFFYKKEYNKDQAFNYLFVGNLSKRKGIDLVLQAYEKVRNKNTKLVLAGFIEKQMKNILNQYLKFDDIIFLGKIKNSEMYKLYSSSHLMLVVSAEEGFAAVIGEALASGLPVICSKNSGGSHFIKNKNHGKVMDNVNLNELIDIMKEYQSYQSNIIENKQELSDFFRNNYSWEKSTKNLVKILNNLY